MGNCQDSKANSVNAYLAVITRMGKNSSMYKWFSVLVAFVSPCILYLLGTNSSSIAFSSAIIMFGALDAYYIMLERVFVKRLNCVLGFDMDNGRSGSYFESLFSKSVAPFYLVIACLPVLMAFLK